MRDETGSLGRIRGVRALPRIMVSLLASLAALLQPVAAETGAQSYAPPAQSLETAGRLAKAFEALAERIPAHEYDIYELADHLNYDFDTAVAYVTERVAFDPYIGVMRGPAGTLNAGSGSAWDQSLLLAALINTMAGEAQVVQGTITEDDARRLLELSLSQSWSAELQLDVQSALNEFEDALPESRLDRIRSTIEALRKPSSASPPDREAAVVASLLAELREGGIDLAAADPVATNVLVGRLEENYAWVRYRDGPGGEWAEIHPAFGSAPSPSAIATAYHADEAPEAMQHHLEFRLAIERFDGTQQVREPLMDPFRRPVANLSKGQQTLGVAPSKPRIDGSSGFFVPFLNNAIPPGGLAFTLSGLTAPAGDALAGPEVFATTGEKLNKAAQALGGMTSEEGGAEHPQLTGIILTVDWIAPGGSVESQERRIKDLRRMPLGDVARAIPFDGVIDIGTGRTKGAAEVASILKDQSVRARALPFIAAIIEGSARWEQNLTDVQARLQQLREPWMEMTSLRPGFEGERAAAAAHFRQGPLVVYRTLSFENGGDPTLDDTIDILINPSTLLVREKGRVAVSPAAALKQGIRETFFERLVIGADIERPRLDFKNATLLRSRSDVTKMRATSSIGPAIEERIIADLSSGQVVLAGPSKDGWFWWRVDPETGRTLGMSRRGGSAYTEYVVKMAAGGVAFLLWVDAAITCNDTYRHNEPMRKCCVLGNTMLAGAGSGAGGAMSQVGKQRFLVELGHSWQAVMGYIGWSLFSETMINQAGLLAGSFVDNACSEIVD